MLFFITQNYNLNIAAVNEPQSLVPHFVTYVLSLGTIVNTKNKKTTRYCSHSPDYVKKVLEKIKFCSQDLQNRTFEH